MKEINTGFIDFIKKITPAFVAPHPLTFKRKIKNIVAYFLLFSYSILLKLFIEVYLFFVRKKPSYDYRKACNYTAEFVRQYPFHLYPIIAKSLEHYFLEHEIMIHNYKKIIEIAIGEGSFSKRIFDHTDVSIYAFDINPYFIDKVNFNNVKMKIVSNCLRPPIPNDSSIPILSNNLFAHITDKESVLQNWSRKTSRIIFNENTVYWASGETTIYIANFLGLTKIAEKRRKELVNQSLVYLLDIPTLDKIISKNTRIDKKFSFYTEFVHFLAMNYSFIYNVIVQPCVGPPTPETFKRQFSKGGILSKLMWSLTKSVADSMIHLDSIMPRDKDSFVYYDCLGNIDKEKMFYDFKLSCVKCSGLIENNKCTICDKKYNIVNDMLFVLDDNLEEIEKKYNIEVSKIISKEHL